MDFAFSEKSLRIQEALQSFIAAHVAPRAPRIESVQHCQEPYAVGQHAVIELNHQDVLEHIAPQRLDEQQLVERRHDRAG